MAKAAYDFEYFMPSKAVALPKQAPVLQVRKNEKKQQRSKMWRKVRLFFAVTAMLVLACGVLYTQSVVAELQNEIGVQSKLLAEENTAHRSLTAQLDGKVNLKTVEQQAAALGLIRMENSQKTYIRAQQENQIEVRQDGFAKLLENTRNSMMNMMDYLSP